ncbi:BsuPI-related putative proteinase inhibitor [Robertmurraya massiliosenegalensis]|uniref:BsuPI-related putative proteinase inhibitor n=1 Tax=Robertmurraya TaxID=2837507 RepID=UPI0039A73339
MFIHLRKKAVLLTALIFVALTGCGTTESSKDENTNGGSVAKEMEVSIEQNGDLLYQLTIQNNKEKEETLTFPSSQDYDYSIKNQEGTIVYTYSADKMFAAAVEEEVLAVGEKLEFDLDLSEVLSFVEPGDYTLEAWITATGIDENKVSIDFNYE